MRSIKFTSIPFIYALGWAVVDTLEALAVYGFRRRAWCRGTRLVALFAVSMTIAVACQQPGPKTLADKITITSVPSRIVIGQPSPVQVQVTARRSPVPKSVVSFEITGLGKIPGAVATTNDSGVAKVQFDAVKVPGVGFLTATVVDHYPPLKVSIPIRVVKAKIISIDPGLTTMKVQEGTQEKPSEAYNTLVVNFSPKKAGTEHHISVSQEWSPKEGIAPELGSKTWIATGVLSVPLTQTVNVNPLPKPANGLPREPKRFKITTTATVEETGDSATASYTLIVLPKGLGDAIMITRPRTLPGGIAVGSKVSVLFTSAVKGTDKPPVKLILEELNAKDEPIGQPRVLSDNGKGDLQAGDFVYSGVFDIVGDAVGEKRYRVRTPDSWPTVWSPIMTLVVVPKDIPVGFKPVSVDTLVKDKKTGQVFASDQLLVKFKKSLPPAEVGRIVEKRGAKILGFKPDIGVYQLGIDGGMDPAAVLEAVKAFKALDVTEFAEFNGVYIPAAIPPDGGTTAQWSAVKVNADDAWLLTRGTNVSPGGAGVVVALLDTGVDYNHRDLSGRVLMGPDYTCNGCTGTVTSCPSFPSVSIVGAVDCDPYPDYSTLYYQRHGTAAAGIIAAAHDGPTGVVGAKDITGIAPEATILAIRLNYSNDGNVVWTAFADAVGFAATAGAAVVTLNVQSPPAGAIPGSDASTVATAITNAYNSGSLLVGAAGNHNSMVQNYPCAYPEVLCVGGTTNTDGRWSNSNYGTWVDIGAPAEGISTLQKCSTGPTGSVCGGTISTSDASLGDGTSWAAPHVAGAAALLFAREPSLTACQAKARLLAGASPGPANLGNRRLDVFHSLFNGGFEIDGAAIDSLCPPAGSAAVAPGWEIERNCGVLDGTYASLGPTDGSVQQAFCQTGPVVINTSGGQDISTMTSRPIDVPAEVTQLRVDVDYRFISDEFDKAYCASDEPRMGCTYNAAECKPNWIGWLGPGYFYNDRMKIELVDSTGTRQPLCNMDVDVDYNGTGPTTPFVRDVALYFPENLPNVQGKRDKYPQCPANGGTQFEDRAVGHLGWNYVPVTAVPGKNECSGLGQWVTLGGTGPYKIELSIADEGDQIWDSHFNFDNIRITVP